MTDRIVVEEFAPGQYRRWRPGRIRRIYRTATLRTVDGQETEVPHEPYEVDCHLFSTEGLSAQDLADCHLHIAEPFVVPKGKVPIGSERFEMRSGRLVQVYDIEEERPPRVLTTEEKLSAAGLSKDELRALLAD